LVESGRVRWGLVKGDIFGASRASRLFPALPPDGSERLIQKTNMKGHKSCLLVILGENPISENYQSTHRFKGRFGTGSKNEYESAKLSCCTLPGVRFPENRAKSNQETDPQNHLIYDPPVAPQQTPVQPPMLAPVVSPAVSAGCPLGGPLGSPPGGVPWGVPWGALGGVWGDRPPKSRQKAASPEHRGLLKRRAHFNRV
jgi:hypothetical protein